MTTYVACGSPQATIDRRQQELLLAEAVQKLGTPRKLLVVPPDMTRRHSGAGELTSWLYAQLGRRCRFAVMPALGTHTPMTAAQLAVMFPGVPPELFLVHDWRRALKKLGEIPSELVRQLSEGQLDCSINVELNRAVPEGRYDLILSIGQVVPHEVIGMANHVKNILIGVGGQDIINKSHFLGAVYGLERIMGRSDTPVRQAFYYAEEKYLKDFPICYILTVIGREAAGKLVMRGLFVGDDHETFQKAAALSRQVNLDLVDEPLRKVIVHLDPQEYKSTWLGNKAVYRTRMALGDGGELVVLAPGLVEFGEDAQIDGLIRKYGYRGTPAILEAVRENADLRANLAAAAHLIHGSSEGRFKITYCPGAGISRQEIEAVNFAYGDLAATKKRYRVETLKEGDNEVNGERVFYISNPALGLWARKSQFA